jgi:hypothetical protein
MSGGISAMDRWNWKGEQELHLYSKYIRAHCWTKLRCARLLAGSPKFRQISSTIPSPCPIPCSMTCKETSPMPTHNEVRHYHAHVSNVGTGPKDEQDWALVFHVLHNGLHYKPHYWSTRLEVRGGLW